MFPACILVTPDLGEVLFRLLAVIVLGVTLKSVQLLIARKQVGYTAAASDAR